MTHSVKTEDSPAYVVARAELDDSEIIARALAILNGRIASGPMFDSPNTVKHWLCMRAAGLQHEVFGVVFLDAQHRVIEAVDMFRGTISQASVYPREVVKAALARNAAAVLLTHNHPSGVPEPSRADEHLTQTLKAALAMVDVRVVDHVITAAGHACSMAERGLI